MEDEIGVLRTKAAVRLPDWKSTSAFCSVIVSLEVTDKEFWKLDNSAHKSPVIIASRRQTTREDAGNTPDITWYVFAPMAQAWPRRDDLDIRIWPEDSENVPA